MPHRKQTGEYVGEAEGIASVGESVGESVGGRSAAGANVNFNAH